MVISAVATCSFYVDIVVAYNVVIWNFQLIQTCLKRPVVLFGVVVRAVASVQKKGRLPYVDLLYYLLQYLRMVFRRIRAEPAVPAEYEEKFALLQTWPKCIGDTI